MPFASSFSRESAPSTSLRCAFKGYLIAYNIRNIRNRNSDQLNGARTFTLSLCSFKQKSIRRWYTSATSGPYRFFVPRHSSHPFSCTTFPSMTPSLIAFPTMYSASSSESKWSLTQMSRSDMREYDRESRRMPVLMTFCLRREMRVYVLSASNCAACFVRVVWNCEREPVRTAIQTKISIMTYSRNLDLTFDNFEVGIQSLF